MIDFLDQGIVRNPRRTKKGLRLFPSQFNGQGFQVHAKKIFDSLIFCLRPKDGKIITHFMMDKHLTVMAFLQKGKMQTPCSPWGAAKRVVSADDENLHGSLPIEFVLQNMLKKRLLALRTISSCPTTPRVRLLDSNQALRR